ncbi:hypothetical protein BC940DRAFT_296143 [Gongronella butleri]|nr:hypothetical protein BC940DRAFT_296143 [Gongronella butleri]
MAMTYPWSAKVATQFVSSNTTMQTRLAVKPTLVTPPTKKDVVQRSPATTWTVAPVVVVADGPVVVVAVVAVARAAGPNEDGKAVVVAVVAVVVDAVRVAAHCHRDRASFACGRPSSHMPARTWLAACAASWTDNSHKHRICHFLSRNTQWAGRSGSGCIFGKAPPHSTMANAAVAPVAPVVAVVAALAAAAARGTGTHCSKRRLAGCLSYLAGVEGQMTYPGGMARVHWT